MIIKPPEQLAYFKDCIYICEAHKILITGGNLLSGAQFDVQYGGVLFDMNKDGTKQTDSAWQCFTKSQAIKFPRAQTTCFRPAEEPLKIITENGVTMANCWWPVNAERKEGNPEKFLDHLEKMIPDETDRAILLSWMSSVVQNPGVKFQWSPLIQGMEGNGKTMLIECLAYCVGKRYFHAPNVQDFAGSGGKFTGWIQNKLLIGMEEVCFANNKNVLDILKPIITNTFIESQKKGVDQVTIENRANFMFFSNHKDGMGTTSTDRRYAVFYTAQQFFGDLTRDGMAGNYFPRLWDWLRAEGFAIVHDYLANYVICDALNPAKDCVRAPVTTSTREAIITCRGEEEHAIIEAIDEGRFGFRGGWISGRALEHLYKEKKVKFSYIKRYAIMSKLGYEGHPFYKSSEGRVHYLIDEGDLGMGKPKLFIRRGNPAFQLKHNNDIADAYLRAQNSRVFVEEKAA